MRPDLLKDMDEALHVFVAHPFVEEGLWRGAVERGCGKGVCRVLLQSGCGEWLFRGAAGRCHNGVPQRGAAMRSLKRVRCIFGYFGDDFEELRS